jgi:hypothetical protein
MCDANDEKDTRTEMFQKLQLSLKRENCGTKFFSSPVTFTFDLFLLLFSFIFHHLLRFSLTSILASHEVKKKASH